MNNQHSSNIKLLHFYGQSLNEGALIARKNRLYVSIYQSLCDTYREIVKNEVHPEVRSKIIISIIFVDDRAVGTLVYEDGFVQAFVKKDERRKGYATMLFKEMLYEAIKSKIMSIDKYITFGGTHVGFSCGTNILQLLKKLKKQNC